MSMMTLSSANQPPRPVSDINIRHYMDSSKFLWQVTAKKNKLDAYNTAQGLHQLQEALYVNNIETRAQLNRIENFLSTKVAPKLNLEA